MDDKKRLLIDLDEGGKVLIGLGSEWAGRGDREVMEAYRVLAGMVRGRDWFAVTTVTDGLILKSGLEPGRIVAPCGNEGWRQCSAACTKDIWEEGELEEDACPHCGAPLIGNTVHAGDYIEEGYLPQWKAYMGWLSGTVNHRLLVLELGVGFQFPTIIRWPFEKTVYFNQRSHMYRINHSFAQPPEEIAGRVTSITEDSVNFIRSFVGLDIV